MNKPRFSKGDLAFLNGPLGAKGREIKDGQLLIIVKKNGKKTYTAYCPSIADKIIVHKSNLRKHA